MVDAKSCHGRRPRELRRRVILPARLRTTGGWSDACILNVSSRGLMIHAHGRAQAGTMIELRHQQHIVVARVMWVEGARAGLLSEDRIPVEEIMILGEAPALPTAAGAGGERRRVPRAEDNRICARRMEFAGVITIAGMLTLGMMAMVQSALARPLAAISAALGGG